MSFIYYCYHYYIHCVYVYIYIKSGLHRDDNCIPTMSHPLGLQWDGNVYELLRCSCKYFRIQNHVLLLAINIACCLATDSFDSFDRFLPRIEVGSGSCANITIWGFPKMGIYGGIPNHSKLIPFSIGTHGFRDPYFKKPLFLALDMSVDKKNNTILSHRHEHRQLLVISHVWLTLTTTAPLTYILGIIPPMKCSKNPPAADEIGLITVDQSKKKQSYPN